MARRGYPQRSSRSPSRDRPTRLDTGGDPRLEVCAAEAVRHAARVHAEDPYAYVGVAWERMRAVPDLDGARLGVAVRRAMIDADKLFTRRRSNRETRRRVEVVPDVGDDRARDDNDMARRRMECGEEADAALSWFPSRFRAVARLRALDLTTGEVARLLGISEPTVCRRLAVMRERVA